MPDRYLRGAILLSDRFNACSVDAREFFYRLITVVDDYGCFDGRPNIIASRAYPLGRIEPPPLDELHRAGLIVRYTNAGKPFMAMMQWGEIKRGARKFPAPPVCNELPNVKYQGYFGRAINWRNPQGSDPQSTLVDVNGRQVVPQPAEWRDVAHDCAPLFLAAQQSERQALAPKPDDGQALVPKPTAPSSGAQALAPSAGVQGLVPVQRSTVIGSTVNDKPSQPSPPVSATAPSPATTTPTTNGKIELTEDGQWRGLAEARRLQWQDMFHDLSIPDQLDRAAQWLLAHPEERKAYTRDEGGLDAYLVRWLLREARPLQH